MNRRCLIKEWIKRISIKARHRITVWSIALGFFGIGALFVSIIGNKVEKDKVACSHSVEVAAREVINARWNTGRRVFNEGLYTRISLDSLQTDYNNYVDWIDCYADCLDSLMNLSKPVDLNTIGKPVFTSSMPGELEDFLNRYINSIKSYNECAYKLQELDEKAVVIKNVTLFAEILSAIFITLSTLLQLILAFHSYYNDIEKSNACDVEHDKELANNSQEKQ